MTDSITFCFHSFIKQIAAEYLCPPGTAMATGTDISVFPPLTELITEWEQAAN